MILVVHFLKITMKKAALFILQAIRIYLAILVSFVTTFLLLALVPVPNNYKFHLVTSGSMEPAIKIGSLVVTVPVETYFPGDIITFSDAKRLITHRIVGFSDAEFGPVFKTQGDRNKTADIQTVGVDKIVGKVILAVPYIGYFLSKIKTPIGFILAVIVPATIIVYEELKSLFSDVKNAVKGFFINIKQRNNNVIPISEAHPESEANSGKIGMTGYIKTEVIDDRPISQSVILPIVMAAAALITLTGAYFLDSEESLANIFEAGVWSSPAPNGSPPTTPSPSLIPNNPNCPSLGYAYGFRLNSAAEGNFTLTQPPGELSPNASPDPNISVTISNVVTEESEPKFFDWIATLGMDGVIVKGGDNADVYIYDPESFGDTGLHAPLNTNNNKFFGISHIEFCYDQEND